MSINKRDIKNSINKQLNNIENIENEYIHWDEETMKKSYVVLLSEYKSLLISFKKVLQRGG